MRRGAWSGFPTDGLRAPLTRNSQPEFLHINSPLFYAGSEMLVVIAAKIASRNLPL